MIYLMTSLMGIYYVVSNLVSLALLTVLRFLVADNAIWGKTTSSSRSENSTSIRRRTVKNKLRLQHP